MNFENAKILSTVLHYAITLSVSAWIGFSNYKNFFNLVLKFYGLFLLWGIITFSFWGCPLTKFENWLSTNIYGKPFYPNYTFTGSDFYFLITSLDFYIPAILSLVVLLVVKNFKDNA